MHRYESYGNWEDCSEYWNNTTESNQIKLTIKRTKNNSQSNQSNRIGYKLPDQTNKNEFKTNKSLDRYENYPETTTQKNDTYFLNKQYLSKKLTINNINDIIKSHGKNNNR